MPKNFYELASLFFIYAFIGWCVEVAYAAVNKGEFVNRGFLNGPLCPIYGCGMVIVVEVLYPIRENLILLFIGSSLLTTILEFLVGFLLEKIFHSRWWDYSALPFNIGGYVCLKFSIYWGFGGMVAIDMVHPPIYEAVHRVPQFVGNVIVCVISVFFILDCAITVMTILKLNERLRMIDDVGTQLQRISDGLGENIYENIEKSRQRSEGLKKSTEDLSAGLQERRERWGVSIQEKRGNWSESFQEKRENWSESFQEKRENWSESFQEKREDWSESFQEKRENWSESFQEKREDWSEEIQERREQLQKSYRELIQKSSFGIRRLMRAFPNMKSTNLNETFQKYKEAVRKLYK